MLNRILDGFDGMYARKTGRTTEFGGYLDIIVDFTIYGLIPVAIVAGRTDDARLVIAMGVLEVAFFVNAAGLFMLSAILEKRIATKKDDDEVTAVTMPPGLIEGAESMILFFVMLIVPQHAFYVFVFFAAGVFTTVLQRVVWAN